MLSKIIQLEDRFPTGEPTLMVVAREGRTGWLHEKRALASSASPALDYIQSVTPRAGSTIVLVNALGAFETYDDNRNGDAFPELPYNVGKPATCGHQMCQTHNGWIGTDEVLIKHYQTFEQFGGIYEHHVNKDPAKSLGKILKAFWNARMHRVELLLELINARKPELIARIADGDFPAVSMGCALAGTRVTLADGRRKNIEDIQVTDEVLTHEGRGRQVFALRHREYRGTVYTVKTEAAQPLSVTHEHPFLVARADDVRKKDAKGNTGWRPDAVVTPVWKLATELRVGEHFLLQPVDRHVETPEYATKAFARLLGYYLAEGNIIRNRNGEVSGFELSCHQDDELLKELPVLCKELHLPSPAITQRSHSVLARSVRVYSLRMATKLAVLCGLGAHAKDKWLDASVMQWDPSLQRELFGAYVNGDGCGNANGSLQISTASETLADQWLALLPRLGVLASRQRLEHKANKLVHRSTVEHVVFIGSQWAQSFRDVCAKVKSHVLRAKKESRKIIGDFVVSPIRSISSAPYVGPVFNFEVEEDNTYVTEGAVSHNCHVKWDVCSVCGHRAPTRRDYCDHLKFEMRKIDPRTGIRYCALNPSCRFFDISIVIRPADTTGFMMKKVAEEGRRGWSGADLGEKVAWFNTKQALVRKLSDIQKDLVGDVMAARITDEGALVKNYRKQLLSGPPLTDCTNIEVVKMARFPLPQVFSTLAKHGTALSAAETAAVLGAKCGHTFTAIELDKIAAALPLVSEVFAQDPELYEKIAETIELDPRHISTKLASDLGAWLTKRAGITDWFRQTVHDAGGPMGRGAPFGPGAAYEAHAPPKTDVFTMTDPNTGEMYKTTRGAVHAANDTDYRALLGGAALLSGGYAMALGRLPLTKRLSLGTRMLMGAPLAAGTLHAGRKLIQPYDGGYMTDQGYVVPGNVEFQKTSAQLSATLVDKLALDYAGRLPADARDGDMAAALTRKIASSVGHNDPLMRFFSDPRTLSQKVALLLSDARDPSFNATEPDHINFDRASQALGQLLATR